MASSAVTKDAGIKRRKQKSEIAILNKEFIWSAPTRLKKR
jgi:hypothetical protein